MITQYRWFLACSILLGHLLFGSVQTMAAGTTPLGRSITHASTIKSVQSILPVEIVVISISQTTNSCAQKLFVFSSGLVTYVTCNIQKQAILPMSLIKTFFHDIHVSSPLSTLPTNKCLKTISFNSTTYLQINAQKSPDVSCSLDILGKVLEEDVLTINTSLHI